MRSETRRVRPLPKLYRWGWDRYSLKDSYLRNNGPVRSMWPLRMGTRSRPQPPGPSPVPECLAGFAPVHGHACSGPATHARQVRGWWGHFLMQVTVPSRAFLSVRAASHCTKTSLGFLTVAMCQSSATRGWVPREKRPAGVEFSSDFVTLRASRYVSPDAGLHISPPQGARWQVSATARSRTLVCRATSSVRSASSCTTSIGSAANRTTP